jgi:hypothetical protein
MKGFVLLPTNMNRTQAKRRPHAFDTYAGPGSSGKPSRRGPFVCSDPVRRCRFRGLQARQTTTVPLRAHYAQVHGYPPLNALNQPVEQREEQPLRSLDVRQAGPDLIRDLNEAAADKLVAAVGQHLLDALG